MLRPDGDLDWASYEGPDSLVPARAACTSRRKPPRGVDAIARADVVLVPALAVDQAGNRLGRGGGSYDRALARVGPLIPVIALLYDAELLEPPASRAPRHAGPRGRPPRRDHLAAAMPPRSD